MKRAGPSPVVLGLAGPCIARVELADNGVHRRVEICVLSELRWRKSTRIKFLAELGRKFLHIEPNRLALKVAIENEREV
jgi:hypothetical protein